MPRKVYAKNDETHPERNTLGGHYDSNGGKGHKSQPHKEIERAPAEIDKGRRVTYATGLSKRSWEGLTAQTASEMWE